MIACSPLAVHIIKKKKKSSSNRLIVKDVRGGRARTWRLLSVGRESVGEILLSNMSIRSAYEYFYQHLCECVGCAPC